jgi:act minimal PKS chain-length factor (CLF/KS beta)
LSSAATAPLITGIGITAPTGLGAGRHWESVLAGKSGIARISHFDPSGYPVRFAGEVDAFETAGKVPGRVAKETDRWTHLALVAADEALADAGADPAAFPEYGMAVVTSSSSGGTEFGQHEMENLYLHDSGWVSAYQSIAWFYAATSGQISIRHGMRGSSGVLCCEQAGGLDALAQARRLLRDGAALVVSGGTDASLCPYGLTAQLSTGLLSTVADPYRAYLPFDAAACGFLPGEGGAILTLEDPRDAAARGHRGGYAQVLGHAAGFDPVPGTGRPPALRRTIERALTDAGLTPRDIDAVFADAAGVPELDAIEARALGEVFRPYGVPVTAPKVLTGRLYGGGAPLDVATAAISLREQVLPHTPAPITPDPAHRLDLVRDEPRRIALGAVLVLARGHGGFNSALVLGRWT